MHMPLFYGLNVGQWNPSRLLNNWLFGICVSYVFLLEHIPLRSKWSSYIT